MRMSPNLRFFVEDLMVLLNYLTLKVPEITVCADERIVQGFCGHGQTVLISLFLARISVMGGEQAAGVLCQITRDAKEKRGETWSISEQEKFQEPIRKQYELQGHPYYASARLWDDGIIDPKDTRTVLGLGLSAAMNTNANPTTFGVFRM